MGGSSVFILCVLEALRGSSVRNLCVREAPGRVGCLTNLTARVGPLEKDLTRAGGESLGRLWEAQSIVFYVSGRVRF